MSDFINVNSITEEEWDEILTVAMHQYAEYEGEQIEKMRLIYNEKPTQEQINILVGKLKQAQREMQEEKARGAGTKE